MVAVESTFENIPSFFSSGGKSLSSSSFSPSTGHRSSWSSSGSPEGRWRKSTDNKNYTGGEDEKRTLMDINNSTMGMPTGALVGGSSSPAATVASSSPPPLSAQADVPSSTQDTNQVGFFQDSTTRYLTIGGSILGVTFLVVAVVVMTVMTKRSRRNVPEHTLANVKGVPRKDEDEVGAAAAASELCDMKNFDEDAQTIPPLSRFLTISVKDTDEDASKLNGNQAGEAGNLEGGNNSLHPNYHQPEFLSSLNRPYQLDESLARTSQSFSNYFSSFLAPNAGSGGETAKTDSSALKQERVIETTSPYGAPRRISKAASRFYAVNEQSRDSVCSVMDVPMNYAVRRISEEPSAKRSLRVMNRTTTIVD